MSRLSFLLRSVLGVIISARKGHLNYFTRPSRNRSGLQKTHHKMAVSAEYANSLDSFANEKSRDYGKFMKLRMTTKRKENGIMDL